ncbi:MAG: UDP-N-acetylglucosamine 2-epimerase (non-hydrolyzing) [Flavobacteriaceae bacterium]|nr:UDP-N-acetylglucosamine 2-epimerase (non-hydrolyzing) [Flavobacteriaceae bacterium]
MKDLAIVLGIRPDVIRASKILKLLENQNEIDFDFLWSGQHYSENMKDTFFTQLNVPRPNFEFSVDKSNDSTIVSSTIENLYKHFETNKYKAVVFLGDTNTVMGSVAAAQHNIPIVHIEGCMRSYDWRMPEEKYRTVIDHLSDRIYAYLDNYKTQGLNEGISENIIKVTGNPIVDIINENSKIFDSGVDYLDDEVLSLSNENFVLVTCHRRENILNEDSLKNIISLLNTIDDRNIIFPMGYKTQEVLKNSNIQLNTNIKVLDPIGYLEFMYLLKNSNYVATDSGTVVEEACILNVPSIQMRYSTERPEVYDVRASVKFDPTNNLVDSNEVIGAVMNLNRGWSHPFGDGNSSEIIVKDLIELSNSNTFKRHSPKDYPFDTSRSFKE